MKLTVKIKKLDKGNNILALASVTFDDSFVVHDFKIMSGSKGIFVSMPSKKVDTEYRDTAYPVTAEFRNILINAILEEYNKEA